MAIGVEIATAYVSVVPSFRGIKANLTNGLKKAMGITASDLETPLVDGVKKAAKKAAQAANAEVERELRPWVRKVGNSVTSVFSRIGDGLQGLSLAKQLGANVATKELSELEVSTARVSGRFKTAMVDMGVSVKNAFKSFSASEAQTDGWGQRFIARIGSIDDAITSRFSRAGNFINTKLGSAFSSVNTKMAETVGMSEKSASKFGSFATSAAGGLAMTAVGFSAVTAAAAVAATAVAGVGLAVAGINRLSTIQTSTLAFETMLGSAEKAKKVMEELTTFAKSTPFPLAEITSAAKTLKAMGQDTDKLVPTLKAAGDAAAALGTGTAGMQHISWVMGQIITKGKIEGDELNQLGEAGINASKILGNKLGVEVTKVNDKLKDMGMSSKEAVNMLVDGIENGTDGINGATSKMGGLMEKFKNTWEGRWTDMKAAFSRLGATIFEPLFVSGQGTMAGLTVLMDKAGEAWKRLAAAFSNSGAAAALDRFKASLGAVARALVPMEGGFKTLADQIFPALRMSLNVIAEAFEKFARWIKENEWIAKLLGYALVGLAIVLIAAAVAAVLLVVALALVSAALWVLIGAIVYGLYNIIKYIAANIGTFFEGVGHQFMTLLRDIVTVVGDFLMLFVEAFSLVSDLAAGIFSSLFELLKAIVVSFYYFITGQWDRIGEAWSNLGGRLSDIWGGVWADIVSVGTRAINILTGLINSVTHQINGLINLINSIPGVNIPNIPSIPRLASGGIATSATTAIIGEGAEPEAVMPLSKLENFINANPAKGEQTQIVISAAGADRQFLTFLRALVRKQGGGDVQKAFGV